MIRPDTAEAFFTQSFIPAKYATYEFPNFSLAKTAASSVAIFIPIHNPIPNVNFTYKNEPPKVEGGENLERPFKEMTGSGVPIEKQLHHPIKVPLKFV